MIKSRTVTRVVVWLTFFPTPAATPTVTSGKVKVCGPRALAWPTFTLRVASWILSWMRSWAPFSISTSILGLIQE